jgi:hypothetical protein
VNGFACLKAPKAYVSAYLGCRLGRRLCVWRSPHSLRCAASWQQNSSRQGQGAPWPLHCTRQISRRLSNAAAAGREDCVSAIKTAQEAVIRSLVTDEGLLRDLKQTISKIFLDLQKLL